MRRRVLIVTSSWFPAMIADMHRARHLAWELPGLGWDVEILSPDASYQRPFCLEGDSAPFFAQDIPVHSVHGFWRKLFRALRFGSIGWRALYPMWREGRRLLAGGAFDLAYFSTTQFPLFLLGPSWKKTFGVPFVLDFHDPCFRDGARHPVWARPSLKHAVSRWLAKHVESRATTVADGLVAVSPEYLQALGRRYSDRSPRWLGSGRQAVIPFSVLERDFEEVETATESMPVAKGPPLRIVYVGAGGPIMARSFALLCRTLAGLREMEPDLVQGIRFELYGTVFGWKEGEPRALAELAAELGVRDLVLEAPGRVSYRRSIELLLDSDGALILGVDDAGYMPSKLFSYAFAGKPLLAAVHRDSPAYAAIEAGPDMGHALWFGNEGAIPAAEASQVMSTFLKEVSTRKQINRRAPLERFATPAMARKHVELFDRCLRGAG